MDRIRAPYNFVPLSPKVVFPDWADVPAIDAPFKDGICGTIELELETFSPLFVRGQDKEQFFALPDGSLAIPGSSVRGMLRNVVEIASLGKLGRFNDHRYGVRDLNNRRLYTGHMASMMVPVTGGRAIPLPLVDSGWLRQAPSNPNRLEILPCDFAKIHYSDLLAIAAARKIVFDPGAPKTSSVTKYSAWGSPAGEELPRLVDVDVRPLRPANARFLSAFGSATPGTARGGVLVFTGQPQRWPPRNPGGSPKQHDFVFFDPAPGSSAISVSSEAFADFEFVHGDQGQQARMVDERVAPNEEWGFWRKAMDRGGRVPVFFLRWPNGELRAFGLAMMFRLAYKHTIGNAVCNAQADALSPEADLADLMFGSVGPNQASKGKPARQGGVTRKGRVSVGLFTPVGSAPSPDRSRRLVLGSPKPSYYPNYIEQGPGFGDRPASEHDYKTLMDDDARIRGWKRYRPHEVVRESAVGADQERTTSTFTPVLPGTFKGSLRIHNLRTVELGALLWALDFGGESDCFHTLGLAKSFGYGRVQLRVGELSVQANDGRKLTVEDCRNQFAMWMEEQLKGVRGGWSGSVQMQDLISLARPVPRDSDEARHMVLDPARRINEFQDAKRSVLALAPVGRAQGRAVGEGQSGSSGKSDGGVQATGARTATGQGSMPATGPTVPSRPAVSPIAGNTTVQARLVDLNQKGKWTAELVGRAGKGVIGLGVAPAGVKAGDVVSVVVTGGGNPLNLVLKWP